MLLLFVIMVISTETLGIVCYHEFADIIFCRIRVSARVHPSLEARTYILGLRLIYMAINILGNNISRAMETALDHAMCACMPFCIANHVGIIDKTI